ncbi:MAG: beta-L-arabinofuranosidase domain-containing protein [Bacteroidota bacterium]
MNQNQAVSFSKLKAYVEKEKFIGYDPYDILNSKIPFKSFGKWPGAILTQIQKRNPINIRPLLGINKEINPKAFGIFLQAYSILYQKTQEVEYLERANYFYQYLKQNYSKGYSGYAWGYNFSWASPVKIVEPFIPSSVVTGFICRGLWQYYQITQNQEVADILISAAKFIRKDLSVFSDKTGKCISYTPIMQDICYNSSLLAAEILAINYCLTSDVLLKNYCIELVDFVVSRQKSDGKWNYSESINAGIERSQIDFHQGYVLESIFEIQKLLNLNNDKWNKALEIGLDFYYHHQFFENGRSLWRLPKEYPVDIHNQSQGIITFSKLNQFNKDYSEFASVIVNWTIDNMQAKDGHFYYRNLKFYKNKISYMRWSQAWMFLALSYQY